MGCDSPQLVMFRGNGDHAVPCEICEGCIRVARDLDRKRRVFWYRRRYGHT